MPETRLYLAYRIQMLGPFHLGTGHGRGLVDRLVARDADGYLYLPGSSIKGRLRATVEALARGMGIRVCDPPRPENMCREEPCLACRLFGSPRLGERLFFSDAVLPEELKAVFAFGGEKTRRFFGQTHLRTQVQISRYLRVAREKLLFTSEYGEEGLGFVGDIKGLVPDNPKREEVLFLLQGLLAMESIGGGNSRGAGRCRVEITSFKLGEESMDPDSLFEAWRQRSERGA